MLNLKILMVALNAIKGELMLVSLALCCVLTLSVYPLPLITFMILLPVLTAVTLAAYISVNIFLLRRKLIKQNLYQLFLAQSEHERGEEIAGYFKGY
ncbi:MAG TPA: hypothetical protein DCR58_03390 [Idiomarina baltica]|jgi:hypothetical protein|uniref:Uncharacterized protein n=2 Tax=Idiomarina TaxID=135575 RepID=A0A348WMQ0_9GAMM|nr:hypothetical protein [Idiomarina baltica]|tara:strand:+ start:162 stop:452 length:291 start_codon:yes stop_codon:yes gene_type:complete